MDNTLIQSVFVACGTWTYRLSWSCATHTVLCGTKILSLHSQRVPIGKLKQELLDLCDSCVPNRLQRIKSHKLNIISSLDSMGTSDLPQISWNILKPVSEPGYFVANWWRTPLHHPPKVTIDQQILFSTNFRYSCASGGKKRQFFIR
jgi:hypothetical protein